MTVNSANYHTSENAYSMLRLIILVILCYFSLVKNKIQVKRTILPLLFIRVLHYFMPRTSFNITAATE